MFPRWPLLRHALNNLPPAARWTVLLVSLFATPSPAAERLRLATDDWPPYEYRDASGQITGYATELVRQVLTRIGVAIDSLELYPWARAEREAQEGTIDLLYTLTVNAQRRRYFYFPDEPLDSDQGVLFVRRQGAQPRITGVADLATLSLGVVRGYGYSPEIRALLARSDHVTEVADETQLYAILARGRVDAVIAYRNVGLAMLTRLQLDQQITQATAPVLFNTHYYVAFAKPRVDPALVQRFSEGLRAFKRTPDYAQLRARYFGAHAP